MRKIPSPFAMCPHHADECVRIHLLTIILNKNTIFPDDRVGSVNYDSEGWTQDETI